MKYTCVFFYLMLILPISAFSQSLFEKSLSINNSEKRNYTLNGHVRCVVYTNEQNYKSTYGEIDFKLKTKSFKYGDAFTNFSISQDLNKKTHTEIDAREAYVNLYFDKFDFRIGQQIIVWGRADGFNPTNNITPYDFSVFSPNEDDKRLSNFVASATYNLSPFKINLNWIPTYKASNLPIKNMPLPKHIYWADDKFPQNKLSNSNYAIKASVEKPSFDASISYFNGYHKTAGIDCENVTNGLELTNMAHHSQVFGLDFSSSLLNYGLRGEFAYSMPSDDRNRRGCIPRNQLEYTIGIDREFGVFSIVAQYIGKCVTNFEELSVVESFTDRLALWNSLIFGQTEELTHSVSLRPLFDLLNQTLRVEFLSLYNTSTEELFFSPKISYKLSDDISLCGGIQIYDGPRNTLFNLLSDRLNSGFVECKISF